MNDEYLQQRSGGGRRFSLVFGGFWLVLFLSTFFVAGSWSGFHGCLFLAVGLLMVFCPPDVALPRTWKILAVTFMVASLLTFLPADWFGVPEWRRHLEEIGLKTGPQVVIQARMAAESLAIFGISLIVGFWLASHRASAVQLRTWALAFSIGVATYAVISRVIQNSGWTAISDARDHFGFFPNRNHSGTYLAMGAVCGLGNLMQSIRDRAFLRLGLSVVATFICFLAVIGWSVSRGGVLLAGIGSVMWICMLGPHYLGSNGRRALALLALAVVGGFLIADTTVKSRISDTMGKAGSAISSGEQSGVADEKPALARDFDFRVPTALDTIDLINDYKLTGIGAGQFYYVFPQYRKLTAVANDSDNYHPESDWLWIAAETGIPATLALLALVVVAFRKSLISILEGRDRALRSACFVAALLVPIHGIFDVPGHRFTLAWSAAFLFALSLRPSGIRNPQQPVRMPSGWPFRIAAFALLAAAVFLIRAEWWGGPQPALTIAKTALSKAQRLYEDDRAMQKGNPSPSIGQGYQPVSGEDLLETAFATLGEAGKIVPLDRGILHYQGFLALHFEGEQETVRKAFEIERVLDPTWVKAPLEQALAWSNEDPEETAKLWEESLRRARWLDEHQPGSLWSEVRTRARILEQSRGKPVLEQLRKERIGG